jgi:hypothetical protein
LTKGDCAFQDIICTDSEPRNFTKKSVFNLKGKRERKEEGKREREKER